MDEPHYDRAEVRDLILDPENPRLPEAVPRDQASMLTWLFENSNPGELASSMLANGFFPHEPLIVIPGSVDSSMIVVEGNRRLAALTILLGLPTAEEAGLDFTFEARPSADQLERLRVVECLVVADRDQVRKYLGFRHIGGVMPWSPEAKARYLQDEVSAAIADHSTNPFRDVGRRVGSNAAGVRGPYIALRLLQAANAEFGLATDYVRMQRFGVWSRLLNSPEIKNYIGFGDPRTLEEIESALPRLDAERLAEVLGDLAPAPGAKRALLFDSRDATLYATIISNERAREVLRKHGDLALAKQTVDQALLPSRIASITNSVELILEEINRGEIDEEVAEASRSLLNATRSLNATVRVRLDDND